MMLSAGSDFHCPAKSAIILTFVLLRTPLAPAAVIFFSRFHWFSTNRLHNLVYFSSSLWHLRFSWICGLALFVKCGNFPVVVRSGSSATTTVSVITYIIRLFRF